MCTPSHVFSNSSGMSASRFSINFKPRNKHQPHGLRNVTAWKPEPDLRGLVLLSDASRADLSSSALSSGAGPAHTHPPTRHCVCLSVTLQQHVQTTLSPSGLRTSLEETLFLLSCLRLRCDSVIGCMFVRIEFHCGAQQQCMETQVFVQVYARH